MHWVIMRRTVCSIRISQGKESVKSHPSFIHLKKGARYQITVGIVTRGWGLTYQQVKENEFCDTIEIKTQLLQQRVRGTGCKSVQLTNDAAVVGET